MIASQMWPDSEKLIQTQAKCSALVARLGLTSFLISWMTSFRFILPFLYAHNKIHSTFPAELTKEGILVIFAWALVIIMNGASLDIIRQAAIILMENSVMEHTRHPRPLIGPSVSALASDWLMVTIVPWVSELHQCNSRDYSGAD